MGNRYTVRKSPAETTRHYGVANTCASIVGEEVNAAWLKGAFEDALPFETYCLTADMISADRTADPWNVRPAAAARSAT